MSNTPPPYCLTYTGQVNPSGGDILPSRQQPQPYQPNPDLIEAVNLAITLQRPLLVMGDPGCGKTMLASALAYEYTQTNASALAWAQQNAPLASHPALPNFPWPASALQTWPFLTWSIKSTSQAKDGLYRYDAVARLRDAQLAGNPALNPQERETIAARLNHPKQAGYIAYGALGKAFQAPLPAVVLIDEIDKAEIDFPNDLLQELDRLEFDLLEIDDRITAQHPPILVITSNQERDLSNAFLRRCIFHYLEFPTAEELQTILKLQVGPWLAQHPDLPDSLLETLVNTFLELRTSTATSSKQASTSELLDWVRAILSLPAQQISSALKDKLPFLGALLKTRDEYSRYQAQPAKAPSSDPSRRKSRGS